jgi:hypothetical protein
MQVIVPNDAVPGHTITVPGWKYKLQVIEKTPTIAQLSIKAQAIVVVENMLVCFKPEAKHIDKAHYKEVILEDRTGSWRRELVTVISSTYRSDLDTLIVETK